MGEGTPHGPSNAISSKTRKERADKDADAVATAARRVEMKAIVADIVRLGEKPRDARGTQASISTLRAQLAELRAAKQLGSASGGGVARK